MSNPALIVFVKNPEPGKVKTRLASEIGDELAFHIYLKLLRHTHETALAVNAERYVFYSSYIPSDDLFEEPHFHRMLQQGAKSPSEKPNDLGIRMRNAFEEVFALGHSEVAIIGSDCPDLSPGIIENCFKSLRSNDAVFGPADDGGYYLLGLKSLIPRLFVNKDWSTSSVLKDSIGDLGELNLNFTCLDVLADIDTLEDLKKHKPQWVPVKTGPKNEDEN